MMVSRVFVFIFNMDSESGLIMTSMSKHLVFSFFALLADFAHYIVNANLLRLLTVGNFLG